MQQNQGLQNVIMAFMAVFIVVAFVVLAIYLTIAIFYLLTLQKALNRVSARNRLMEPGMVWLMLVPLFNEVWQFFVAIRLPDSLKAEFQERNRDDGSNYGKTIALTRACIAIANIFLSIGANILTLALNEPEMSLAMSIPANILGLVNLVLFIVFWVKIANYSRMLTEDDRERVSRLDEFDDDDDDRGYDSRPRPGSGASKPDDGEFKAADPGEYK
jgi:hypothetical protein